VVESIGAYAFNGCTALETVSLPATLTTITGNPFSGCINLTAIRVDAANPNYTARNGMLLNKAGDTLIGYPGAGGSVSLDSTVTAIAAGAFYGCTALKTVSLPAAASIGNNAFNGCTALEEVSLPAAESIGGGVFGFTGSTALVITLGNTVPSLGTLIFDDLIASTIKKTVTVLIPTGAAAWRGKTETYTGSGSVDNWGNAFRGKGWDGTAYLTGPVNSGVTLRVWDPILAGIADYLDAATGGANADYPVHPPVHTVIDDNWAALLSIIQAAGKYVDLDLSDCTMSGIDPEFDPGTADTGERYIVSLVLPDMVTGVREGGSGNPTFRYFTGLKSISGSGVLGVGGYAFSGSTALKTVNLPAAQSIGEGVFEDCNALEMLILGVTSIGEHVFSKRMKLREVSLPAVESIGDYAFYLCTALETVSLPVVESIGMGAFYGCAALETVSFPVVESIGIQAFGDCTALETVSLPATLTTITANPFMGCINLTAIAVNTANPNYAARDGMLLNKAGDTLIGYPGARGTVTLDSPLTAIGDYAFWGCIALKAASLPAAITIGDYAFEDCIALETVSLPAAKTIGNEAFNDTALVTVSFPEVESIGHYAFAGCTNLKTADFQRATDIGSNVFNSCTSLETVNLPAALSIGGYAFYNTGSTALTVTLGSTAPTLGIVMFFTTGVKTVTVKVPSAATGYGSSPTNPTDDNWGNAFRGKGWDGTSYSGAEVNNNITLYIQYGQ
jgi:hypothetical protein